MADLVGITAVWQASLGDRRLLAKRLRNGKPTQEELNFAADIILGKHKKPAHRTQTLRGWTRDSNIHAFVNHLVKMRGFKKEAAVASAMSEFHLSKSGVRDVLKKVDTRRKTLRALQQTRK